MKFKWEAYTELKDYEVLYMVNDFQVDHDFEEFDSLIDCPVELIYMALDYCDYFAEELSYELSINDFNITEVE